MRNQIVGWSLIPVTVGLALTTELTLFWILAAITALALALPGRRSNRPRYLPDQYYARGQSWPKR